MTKLLNRNEAASFIETLDWVKDAPDEVSERGMTKDQIRRFAKEFDYVELDDGAVISFHRPRIMSVFWYNDETDGPWSSEEERHEYFVRENLRLMQDGGFSLWDERRSAGCLMSFTEGHPWVKLPEQGSTDGSLVFFDRFGIPERVEDDPEHRRYLTDAEIEGLRAVNEKRRSSFSKRLASYWKNHSDKVCAIGFWADR